MHLHKIGILSGIRERTNCIFSDQGYHSEGNSFRSYLWIILRIVLFKSLRNCERRNKGKFTLKSNSNKIMLCWGAVGGNIIFF